MKKFIALVLALLICAVPAMAEICDLGGMTFEVPKRYSGGYDENDGTFVYYHEWGNKGIIGMKYELADPSERESAMQVMLNFVDGKSEQRSKNGYDYIEVSGTTNGVNAEIAVYSDWNSLYGIIYFHTGALAVTEWHDLLDSVDFQNSRIDIEGECGGWNVQILGTDIKETESQRFLTVYFECTNHTGASTTFRKSAMLCGFQNGMELSEISSAYSANEDVRIQNGYSLQCSETFVLKDNSDVTIELYANEWPNEVFAFDFTVPGQ